MTFSTPDIKFIAILGDLDHKRDLYQLTSEFGPSVIAYFDQRNQAAYLREHEASLVPPNNPNGTKPSDHTVSTVFEYNYRVDPRFVGRYLHWFQIDWLSKNVGDKPVGRPE